jgi:TonB family protein
MSSAATWTSWEGRTVEGKFPLRQWLGGSDHSVVFATELPGADGGRAAIKLISMDDADAERQIARWRGSSQLSQRALIRIFETGRCRIDEKPLLYVVMECADDNLGQILPQRALSPDEVGEMLPPLLDALSYLHSRGFVHSRVKPSNILAVGDQLKLSSEQITSISEPASATTRRDEYDAPELAAGIVSPAGDVWSVGMTLVAAFTQNASFAPEAQGSPGLPDTIPEPFRGIARDCLQLDPKQRRSIADIKARLQPEGRSVPAPAMPARRAATRGYSRPWRLMIPVAVVLIIVLGWGLFHRSSKLEDSGTANPTPVANNSTAANSAVTSATAPSSPATNSAQPKPADSSAAKAKPPAHPTPAPASPPETLIPTQGSVVHQVLPEIPPHARNTISGTIKIAVHVEVDASGKVTSARLTSPGPSRYFSSLVLKSAQQWEFAAPRVNGQPTPSAWMLRFRLRRGSTQVSPEIARR